MKKISTIVSLLALTLCLCFFTACGSDDESAGDVVTVNTGMLTLLASDESQMSEVVKSYTNAVGDTTNYEVTYYYTLASMMMALNNGDIDRFAVNEATADYTIANSDNLVKVEPDEAHTWSYSMLLMEENTELCDKISEAIANLKDSGELDTITKSYIADCVSGSDPAVVELPTFNGAETITVAVTGDLPPMDFVAVDGTPAGFNCALLAAIAEELQVNIEIITIESDARALALSEGKADVVFWSLSDSEDSSFSDQPDGTIVTLSYFEDPLYFVLQKNVD